MIHNELYNFSQNGSWPGSPWCFNDPAPYRSCAETEPTARSLIDHGATSQQPTELTYSFRLAFSWRETDGERESGRREGERF